MCLFLFEKRVLSIQLSQMSSHRSQQLFSGCTVPLFVLHCGAETVIKAENSRDGKKKKSMPPDIFFFCGKKKLNIFHWCKQTPDLLKIKMKMKKEKQSDSFCRSPWCWNIETHSFLFSFSILAVQLQLHVTVSYSAYTPEHLGQH